MTSALDGDSLRLLVAVAETGSLGRAAARHGITQPSASVRIRRLERNLGVALLVRDTRGSRLTPAGELVVGWAGPVLTTTDELLRGVSALRDQQSATLRIAASLTVAEYLLPEWLVRLHRAEPEIAVQLDVANSSEVIRRVRERTVSVGFIEAPSVPRDLASATVARDRLAIVVAPSHRWAPSRRVVTIDELRSTPLLLREEGSGTRGTLQAAVGQLAPPALQLSTTTAIRGAAIAGSAPAVLSELAVRQDIADGRLVEVSISGVRLDRVLRAVWARSTTPTGPARALLTLARVRRP